MKDILNKLIRENGNCVNLGRHIKASDLNLYNDIMSVTSFINNNRKFNERIYCIINDINSLQLDSYNKPARFINLNRGYSIKGKLKYRQDNKNISTTLKTREEISTDIKLNRIKYAGLVNSTDEVLGEKIRTHIRQWPNNSGKSLYDVKMIKDKDYVVCPITKLRKTSIRKNYTENILGLTMEQYLDIVGKEFVLIAPGHKTKLSDSLKNIDINTGKTVHKLAHEKAEQTLNEVDINTGKTGYKMLGEKSKATHESNINENGLNGYQQIGIHAIIKGNKTKQERGLIIATEDRLDYKHYKNLVIWLTKRNSNHLDKTHIGLAGTDNATQIDHMFSIFEGFKNGVSPFLISSSFNLQVLPWKDNIQKWTRCSISLNELFLKGNYTIEKSDNEFNIIMDIIDNEFDNCVSAGLLFERYNERTKILQ
jgi:hypothetical protein